MLKELISKYWFYQSIHSSMADIFETLQFELEYDFELLKNDVLKIKCIISRGHCFSEIEQKKEYIENAFQYTTFFIRDFFKNIFYIYVNYNISYIKYTPVLTKKVFIGYEMTGEPYLLDFNVNPHLLVCGDSGSGKTCLLYNVVKNLYLNYNSIYLFQLRKNDLSNFGQVISNLEDTYNKLLEIQKLMLYRESNVFDDSERIFLIFEEFSFYNQKSYDQKDTKDLKTKIFDLLTDIAVIGRSLSIFLIIVAQKSTSDIIPTTLKNQLVNRVALHIEDSASSVSLLENSDATNLGFGVGIIRNKHQNYFLISEK